MHTNLLKTLSIAILALILSHTTLFAQAGKAGLSFLKLGASARGVSMGDAMAASVTGAAATYYNPAGLAAGGPSRDSELQLMHKEWIQDTRTEILSSSITLSESSTLGFALNSTTVSDIEIRTRPGPPEGTFTARSFSLSGSYGRVLSENVSAGVTVKYLYEKILVDEATGVAADIGVQFKTPVEDLTAGVMIANIGGFGEFRSEEVKLPTLLRIGPAYAIDLNSLNSRVIVASDLVHIFPESKSYVNVGAEVKFEGTFAVRSGYQFGSEGRGFSAGTGFRYGVVALDYAYAPLASDLGSTHTFSLSLHL